MPTCPYPDCKGERAHGSPHLIEAAAIEKRINAMKMSEEDKETFRYLVSTYHEYEARFGEGYYHPQNLEDCHDPICIENKTALSRIF